MAIDQAAGVHCVSFGLAQEAGRQLGLRFKAVRILTAIPQPGVRWEWSEDSSKRVVSVGRLHWRKRFPDLVAAMSELVNAHPGSRCSVVGAGEELDRVEASIQIAELNGSVELLGKMAGSRVAEVLLSSGVYVQSSIAEGLSNALAEAMALGMPVAATDVGGTSEVIEDGVNGYLLDPARPNTWAPKIAALADRNRAGEFGKAARRTAFELFDSNRHARQFKDFFEAAARGKPCELSNSIEITPPDDERPEQGKLKNVLIAKPWTWQAGGDADICDTFRTAEESKIPTKCQVVGSGPQEDELRYLASFFSKTPLFRCEVTRVLDNQEIENLKASWAGQVIAGPR